MKFILQKKVYIFEPKIIPSIATLIALSILLSLSFWQIKRLIWKKDLINTRIERYEKGVGDFDSLKVVEDNEFYKVSVKGEFLNNHEMFMPALSKRGNNGYHILTPFKNSDEKVYIFDRGWIPLAKKEKSERISNMVEGKQKLDVVIRKPGRKGKFQPENDLKNNFWFFVEPKKMSDYLNIKFEEKIYLEAVNNGPNNSPLGGQTRIYIRNNHLQYSITWFLIAMGLIGVYLAASIKLEKK